jgi:DNA invertase Pin-like site-specific DNA recombinase
MEFVREGDTVVVWKLDRLGRNTLYIDGVDLDAVEFDLQRARLPINDDAAGRMQWVLISGS